MHSGGRLGDKLIRGAHAGAAVLRSTLSRPAAPLKLNLCLTYWCQYRCKTCNIWQRKPTDELTTAEVLALIRETRAAPSANAIALVANGIDGFSAKSSGLAANGYGDHSPQGYSLLAGLVIEIGRDIPRRLG